VIILAQHTGGETLLRRKRGGFALTRTQTAVLLVSPAIIMTFILLLYPIISVFRNSLYDLSLARVSEAKFVWLNNFRRLLTSDPYFLTAVKNTFIFSAIAVPLEFAFGFLVALLLNDAMKGRGIFRTLLMLPWVTPPVVAALMWAWLLNDSYGLINYALLKMGIFSAPRLWLGDLSTAMASVILIDAWRETPFFILILLAGMQTVPTELYEAAKIDGAGRYRQIRHVMLPLIRSSIMVALLVRTMAAFKIFDLIYVLTHGGPAGATEVLATYTYKTTFAFMKLGMGSALAIIILGIVIIFSALYVRLLGKQEIA
jgi:ABC-type sugar transport system permease subunit